MKEAERKEAESRILFLPGRTLFIASLLYLFLGCAAFYFKDFFPAWLLIGISIIPFILTDFILLLFLGDRLSVERNIPASLAQGEQVQVKLIIRRTVRHDWTRQQNRQSRQGRQSRPMLPFSIRLFDLYPDSMSAAGGTSGIFPAMLDRKMFKNPHGAESSIKNDANSNSNINNGAKSADSSSINSGADSGGGNKTEKSGAGAIVFEYNLLPNERGPWFFSGVEFMMSSLMRFWKFRVTHKATSFGRTYPNFKQMARGVELKGKPEKGEIRQIRKRGQGLEFESLRDYQEGDSIRSIDWRATSRNYRLDGKPKLIVRNYQEEQDQQVLFIIDSGYRLPDFQFDSALEAMLLLSYTALKHGDAVAAASFGARDCWIPPRKGMRAFTGLMNSLYDLHSEPVPSSPFAALENALSRLHRRSFIILVSNFREEDGEGLAWILPRINQRHLLLMVSFRESGAEEFAFSGKPAEEKTDEEVLETAAAYTYLANRRRLYRKWEHSGLLVLETSPAHISSALINKYLSVKKSGKL